MHDLTNTKREQNRTILLLENNFNNETRTAQKKSIFVSLYKIKLI